MESGVFDFDIVPRILGGTIASVNCFILPSTRRSIHWMFDLYASAFIPLQLTFYKRVHEILFKV